MNREMFHLRQVRPALLLAGLLILSVGSLLIAAASQTTLVVVDREIAQYWRTSYDILVRPAHVASPVEEKYGLVEANHLSGIWGGITFEQYETIKALPGVELAAPIAMIGYIPGGARSDGVAFPPEPGIYVLEQMHLVDDGARLHHLPGLPANYYYFDRNPLAPAQGAPYRQIDDLIINQPDVTAHGGVLFPFLIAGIDPVQEAILVGLDEAIVAGEYLHADESLAPPSIELVFFDKPAIGLPILINATNYVSLTHQAELKRVILPSHIATPEDVVEQGGASYLATLPTQSVATVKTDGRTIYQRMFEQLAPELVGISAEFGAPALLAIGRLDTLPGPIHYQETEAPPGYTGIVLEVVPPENGSGQAYRTSQGPVELDVLGFWQPRGIFEIEHLVRPADVHSVPLETYFPPVTILQYDENGQPVTPPRPLRPTPNPDGYMQSPPLILTTLEAARAWRGEAAISAIRVRVGDITELTPANQRKIEAIAVQIARSTGLTVDVMVGSSPTRILVRVPGVGYVEEQWIQKGVNLAYRQGIQTGNWLLLATLLVAGSLFTLDLVWAEVVARRRIIALQKALGWRSRTIFAQVVGQIAVLGCGAAVAGILAALALTNLSGWQPLPLELLFGLPLLVVGLSMAGSLWPAWLASRVPPVVGMRQGGIRYRRQGAGLVASPGMYAWRELQRRPLRTALTGLAMALAAALLALLLAITFQQRGMLSGTLLGEFILVNIESFHYAIVAIGLGLAAFSTLNGLLGSILERRREIGVLKAVGWRTAAVARIFVVQGLLLGLTGGCMGAIIGSLAFIALYNTIPLTLLPAFLLGAGVPGMVGALAAIYPARVAARVPPAEAVRYE
jgi:cell division protein FtsX